jgi:PleD family two-component response regulator
LRNGLTGLYNHRYFHERLQAELSRARRHGHEIGLLFVDIDHFKNYNDTHGHPEGDSVLREIGKLLIEGARHEDVVARVRSSDVVARYGGEEFAIILPQTPRQGAEVTAERIRRCIAAHAFSGGDTQPLGAITVSIGVAAFPASAPDAGELIRAADRAMYNAKQEGRNRVCAAPNVRSPPVEPT